MDIKILILNLPGPVLKSGSRWYNVARKDNATLKYYPYPWMMGYATSLMKSKGYRVVMKDAVAMEWSVEETINFIEEYSPTHIVCEPTWASKSEDKSFLSFIDDNIVTVAVGNYATNFPFECLDMIGLDFVVIGEYEFSLLDFFDQYNEGILPGNFVSTQKREFSKPELVENLDEFPFPERDDVLFSYYNEPSCFGNNIVMTSSRGCRLKCGFCNVESIYGCHKYRTRTPKNVVDEMEYLFSKYKINEIYFDDDNMVASKKHIDGICKEIIKRKFKPKWLCMGDGLVDDETLELLSRAGCQTYKWGFEHLDKQVLKAIPKPLDPSRQLDLIRRCRELGIRSYVNLIVGLPEATLQKDREMFEKVIAAKPDLMQIAIATPYPGTNFFKTAKKNGWLVSEDPSYFDATGSSAVSYPDYDANEIVSMFHYGWKRWYRHVCLHQPKTLWFFLGSELSRNGISNTFFKCCSYGKKMLFKK